jgi:hypothetical protein
MVQKSICLHRTNHKKQYQGRVSVAIENVWIA